MGTNNLTKRVGGTIIIDDPNQYATALEGDQVPRNTSGVPTANAGSQGTSALPYLKTHVSSGYWSAGDMKMHHSYNGAVGPGQGWMLCNGRTITEANYDAEFSAGDFATFIGSSPLLNKDLPDMDNKYPVGADATTQDGSAPLTFVGNATHQINIQHSHTINSHTHIVVAHNHQWVDEAGATSNDSTWDINGNALILPQGADKTTGGRHVHNSSTDGDVQVLGDSWTENEAPLTGTQSDSGTDNQLSTTQSVQPESLQVQYFMRII